MSELAEKIKAMIAAPSCCAELKAAGQEYLDVMDKPGEAEAKAAHLKQVIDESVVLIDDLIAFVESERGAAVFGAGRDAFLEKARASKAAGGKYCICDACTNAVAVKALLP